MAEVKYSDTLRSLVSSLKGVVSEYEKAYDRVGTLDALQQDYLHKLEFEGDTYKERAKIATQLNLLRKERRVCKKTVKVLEPLYMFMTSSKGKNVMTMLYEVINQTKQAEARAENAVYINRVLSEDRSDGK